jgi:hypothetical protein
LPENFSDDVFLGKYKKPHDLVEDQIRKTLKGSMADVIQDIGYIGGRFIKNFLTGSWDETFAETISEEYLDPLEIHNQNKFFTFHEGALKNILKENNEEQNSKHYLKKTDFFWVKKNRPYLLVGGTIIYPKDGNVNSLYPLEMTPLYTGVRQKFEFKKSISIGGGYVESFAYDSKKSSAPLRSDGQRQEFKLGRKIHRFTLSDVVGTSGAAPQQSLLKIKFRSLGFPEYKHWSIIRGQKVKGKELPHGDGGHIDNLGLMPLFARKTQNILAFINTPKPFNPGAFNGVVTKKVMVDDLIGYFKILDKIPHNAIFKNGEEKLLELYNGFNLNKTTLNRQSETKNVGTPLVYCDKYEVKNNSRYG